jgi:hypothetical protein
MAREEKTRSGRFVPRNPEKYLGDSTKIFYRSSWENIFMNHLDSNSAVVEWSSEEIIIPYLSPVDGRYHRYFPDFFIRTKNKSGNLDSIIVEIKPRSQIDSPQPKKRMTKSYLREVATYGINSAKWAAAERYCQERGWKFVKMDEYNLGIQKEKK